MGTASRLLAMKRPDLFLCVDAKNRTRIAKAFDVSAFSLQTFEGYWDLMQRIWRVHGTGARSRGEHWRGECGMHEQ